ncbi:Uncharacterized protein PCOAH_00019910 [Plasmodium coatneyi]|uniref:Uncharacterized protein n=1 Tax=Plasmodium coatneyi TaxID=208452 RepID=A0A1B1DY74_9APIC|nr:Uncharacterized protein PCOAH_00019910 [Plasmodium coatneyi]ANQ07714.1 Uncharacterized protein PCOAH_00019910 [Plasmodium coatneyi]
MNFLKIFQSEKKSNNESENPPDGESQKQNETSSPPVTNDVGLNYSQGVNTQEGGTNISPPFENGEEVNVGSHVDGSIRQENFENGANNLMTQPPPQFGGPSMYQQKENYDYPNGNPGIGMPYTHMNKITSDASYPCSTYDMSVSDPYGGGTHGRMTQDNSNANSRGGHSSQYVTNHGVVHNVDYHHASGKNITNIANQKYRINSTDGGETFHSPTDLHVNNPKVNISSFESKTGGTFIDVKSNYVEQISRNDPYNNRHIVADPYTGGNVSVQHLPYQYDQRVNNNNAANGTMSTPGGVNRNVNYAFPSGGFPPGQVTEHNLPNNLMHSFQHQLNDIAFTQNGHVAGGKKGEFPPNQSYMNMYSSVADASKMDALPNGAEYYGKGFPPNGQLRMGKADQKRKQQVGDPRRHVGGEGHNNKSFDTVGKMVRWKEDEEETQLKGKKVDDTVGEEDDKGNEYYYEKTMDFLKKEFSVHHSGKINNCLNDRDMLEKTAFSKLVNFEKKLATERKRVLNYYHEDRKQIYSSTINKDKQFSHIFFNNEKYYDAKEILAYLLPYHTFYLDDICIDSSDDDEKFCENLQNDVREIDEGISQVKDSFRAYTNPSMLWSFNKIMDRTDDQHKRKKVTD